MARLPMVPKAPQEAMIKALFDEIHAARGSGFEMPNLYRVLGNSPPMLKAWVDFAWSLRLHARTSRKIRELLILRGAQISGIAYEWAHHASMALEAGVTQIQIDALADWADSDQFDPRERAVLQLAEEIARGPSASESSITQLKDQAFDGADIVELVLTASFYVCVGRFLKSMDIQLEPEFATHQIVIPGSTLA